MRTTPLRLVALAALALSALPASADADLAAATFLETGASQQEGVAIGDLDGDGDGDLAVAHRNGSLSTLSNLGGGTFAAAVGHGVLWPDGTVTDLLLVDVDRDSDLDVVAAVVTLSGSISVVRNRGNGTFDPPENYDTCYSTQMVVAADLNGDFLVDLAGDSNCFKATIMLNNGDGTFRHNGDFGGGYTPGGIDAGDLDGDGDREVVFGNGTSDLTLLPNDGTGTFGPHTSHDVHDQPQDVKIADLDADGDLDVLATNFNTRFLSVLLNDGNGGLAPSVEFFTESGTENMSLEDFDGDGDPDVVVANRNGDFVSILHNQGNATFVVRHDETAGDQPEDVASGDLNGDALPDVAASHWNSSRVAVYRNITVVTPDADGDRVADAGDCAPSNASAWRLPSGIGDLLLDGATPTRLSWSAPASLGAPSVTYEVLRSEDPSDFSSPACLPAGGSVRLAQDGDTPATGLFAYVVRTRNACGVNAGSASDGTPRVTGSCP